MKRLITLAIMVAFILGTIGMAQARHAPADFLVGAKGDWQLSGNYVKNPTFDKDSKIDPFQAWQRLRTAFEFVASENVKAVFRLHVESKWGQAGHQTFPSNISGRNTLGYDLAYLDLFIPNTDVNMKVGKQHVALPGNLGSHLFDNFAYSVIASTPITDMLGLTLGWSRLTDESDAPTQDDTDYSKDEVDIFYAVVPVKLDGMQLTPFVLYGRSGKYFLDNADGKNANWLWGGLSAKVNMFDPVSIFADFNYGARDELVRDGAKKAGWIAALGAEYKMDMFTPMIWGLYESGESRTSGALDRDSKVMPNLGTGDLSGISPFGFNGSQFRGVTRARFNAIQGNSAWGATGKWGVGLKLKNIAFIDKVTHELSAGYYEGTNKASAANANLFTDKDKAWEVNFNTQYMMYENLAAILELGYMKADLEEDALRPALSAKDDAAWKAAAGFRFRF